MNVLVHGYKIFKIWKNIITPYPKTKFSYYFSLVAQYIYINGLSFTLQTFVAYCINLYIKRRIIKLLAYKHEKISIIYSNKLLLEIFFQWVIFKWVHNFKYAKKQYLENHKAYSKNLVYFSHIKWYIAFCIIKMIA